MRPSTIAPLALATLLFGTLALPAAPAQAPPPIVAEVLCPIFIPEAPVKYCIEITGRGCVSVTITTFGIPTDPTVRRKVCALP